MPSSTATSTKKSASGDSKKQDYDLIDKLELFILRAPLGKKRFWSSQATFPERNSLLVKITSGDLVGWGEAGQYGPPEPVATCISHVLAPRIIGKRVQPTRIWEDLYAFSRDFGQRGTYIEAISGIDIALWDLLGKRLKTPVCELLGGAFRKRVKVYATGCYYRHDSTDPSTIDVKQSAEAAAAEAKAFAECGFKAVKMKVGLLSVKEDLARVAAVRKAIGPHIALMVDSNHAYSASNAARMARDLEAMDIRWFEEPVVPEDLQGYRRVRAATTVPIAGGECSFTRYGFRDMFCSPNGSAVDIAQPDIAACGGLSEFIKICALASSFGVTVIPHVWGSGVGLAAGLHAVSTLPLAPYTAKPSYLENEPVIEFDRNPNPLRDEILKDHKWELGEDGAIGVPLDKPGLGIEVDEDAVRRFHVPLMSKSHVTSKSHVEKKLNGYHGTK
mmetsp:Transcript_30093/g.52873  ORF Transcript_30093/g.52873 Transcript_30093/m.52873 type:complete len:445 (+) Transcript_30093:175-1509(+)|eukprot:CAMPEP_0197522886 /NCGR_PEP_ID=MMETSP1318-20131121/7934_1 /TAXON_ID=552666 /ORGANISM="Partenskyella glossopodia, Strain RCC365" /LENGTH=444 /DNA_ID=CAMNT_0043075395 /DNA_START=168 /DNA_END=1502 /DNA_ORIENTATION=+